MFSVTYLYVSKPMCSHTQSHGGGRWLIFFISAWGAWTWQDCVDWRSNQTRPSVGSGKMLEASFLVFRKTSGYPLTIPDPCQCLSHLLDCPSSGNVYARLQSWSHLGVVKQGEMYPTSLQLLSCCPVDGIPSTSFLHFLSKCPLIIHYCILIQVSHYFAMRMEKALPF